MSPLKAKRPNGRHETCPTTIADSEDTMTTPQTAPDDVLDDWLDAFERAQQRAELAQASADSMQATIIDGQQRADTMRSEAQQMRRDAAEKDATASALLAELEKVEEKLSTARDNIARHSRTAQTHGGNISAEIGKGAEDPRARRERLAKKARETGVPQPHANLPQVSAPSPLDGPNVPIGPEPTGPFPQHDMDAAQAISVQSGEPR